MSSTKLIILITIFYIVLFNYSVLAIEDEFQIQLKQEEQQNDDDTSLFREVENVIDEDSDEDAYRMLKSLQEVSEDEVEDEQEEEFENNVNELYNNEKSTTTNNNNNDNNEEEQLRDEIHNVNENDNSLSNEEDELIIHDEEDPLTTDENEEEEEFDDDEEENEEEEDDDDLSPDFPEFQNEATTEFFENLPKQPMDSIDSQINSGQDTIEDEELDEEIDELEPDQDDDEEEDQEEDINKEIENKEKEEKDQVQENHNIPNSPSFDDSIPWQRPDSGRFYQDIRVKDTNPKQNSDRSYKFWYLFLLSVVLTLLYRSLSHRVSTITICINFGN